MTRFPSTRPAPRPELIAPGSPLYSMLCDATMLIYPLPAFLLPLLHPATADSTSRHDYAIGDDAHVGHLVARVVETFDMVGGVVYGGDDSDDVALSIRELHRDLGGSVAGEDYHPWSRDLWTWNWAAITAAIMNVHGAIRGWPSDTFRADVYLGMIEIGRRFGVLGMPDTIERFDEIWPVERDRIADTASPAVLKVASTIWASGMRRPPRYESTSPLVWAMATAPIRHCYRVSIRAGVPAEHRAAMGLPIGKRDDVYLAVHRLFWRLVPRSVTHRIGERYFERLVERGKPVWRRRFSPEALEKKREKATPASTIEPREKGASDAV
ncbi:MAG: oxygenase MpaB family protein [Rhodococcus sp. (in: high G+C Gram-positive bacteria)]